VARAIAGRIEVTEGELGRRDSEAARAMQRSLKAARQAFVEAVDFIAGGTKGQPNAAYAGSVPYLLLAGNVVAGWQMARSLMVAEDRLAEGTDPAFMKAKIATARFYADHVLSRVAGLRQAVVEGAAGVTAMPVDAF
jgi:hypothetical protein